MKRARWKREVVNYLGVLVGAAMVALALDLFLVPNRIAAGGASGLATVVHYVAGWSVGTVMLIVNIPLFLLSIRIIGFSFGVKTLVGTVGTAVFVDLLAPYVPVLTTDPALATIYGGVLAGVGIGITFRFGGSTGGTDMAARLISRYTTISVGRSLLIVDGTVIALAGIVFSPELAMYALLSVFLTSKTIDVIQEGPSYAKAAFIISERSNEIGTRILTELDRGATSLDGKGLYSGEDRDVLFVIVARHEIEQLRHLVGVIDPDAFVVIADVANVLGEGFRRGSPAAP